nr:FAD-dependent oxidoreductase [Fusobacterium gastrosuis]
MKKYDVIVIGTGAGNIVTDAALDSGLKVAQIEKGKFGGTCLTRGCIPTKVMVTVADFIRENEKVKEIGIETEKVRVNWDTITERVWSKIDESKEILEEYKREENLDVYEGTGFFIKDKVLQVRYNKGGLSEEITADKIIIAAGARSRRIDNIEGTKEVGYITSEDFFGEKFPKKPYKSLIIIGGGAIGTEFAHFFSSLGTKVTLVQSRDRLIPRSDRAVSEQLGKMFSKFGVDLRFNSELKKVSLKNSKKSLIIKNKLSGIEEEIEAEEILVAAGVIPNSDLLELANTNIALDTSGWIRTNEFLETSVDGVYAIGDINGHGQLRHKANYEADIIVNNLFPAALPPGQVEEGKEPDRRFARFDIIPAVIYTYPQVAQVGLTEEEARKKAEEKNWDIKVGYNYYSSTAKGYALGYNEDEIDDGFIKVIIDVRSKKILGAHIIGKEASLLIQPYATMLTSGEIEHVIFEPEIGTELTMRMRTKKYSRYLDPQKVTSITESITAHPALTEVAMWTQYFVPMK